MKMLEDRNWLSKSRQASSRISDTSCGVRPVDLASSSSACDHCPVDSVPDVFCNSCGVSGSVLGFESANSSFNIGKESQHTLLPRVETAQHC